MRAVTSATWCVCVSSTVWCLGRLLRCGSRFHSDAWLTKRGHADQGQYWQHCVACLVHFATALAERPRCISWMRKYEMVMTCTPKRKSERKKAAESSSRSTTHLQAQSWRLWQLTLLWDVRLSRARETTLGEREREGTERDRGRAACNIGGSRGRSFLLNGKDRRFVFDKTTTRCRKPLTAQTRAVSLRLLAGGIAKKKNACLFVHKLALLLFGLPCTCPAGTIGAAASFSFCLPLFTCFLLA